MSTLQRMREPPVDLLIKTIRLLRAQPRTRTQLQRQLGHCQSAVDRVLGWLSKHHAAQLRKERQPDGSGERLRYSWDDAEPVPWRPSRLLFPDAARGLAWASVLLQQAAGGSQAAAAWAGLITAAKVPTTGADMLRAGSVGHGQHTAPLLDAWAQACVVGRAMQLTYRRPGQQPSQRIVQPLRWFISRDGAYGLARVDRERVKTYKLSRVLSLESVATAPPWVSTSMAADEIERQVADQVHAFAGHAALRKSVILAVSPEAADRLLEQGLPGLRWDERIAKPPQARLNRLPKGWRHCSCTLAGWHGLVPLILSNGTGIRVEHPPGLVRQVVDEARTVLRNHRRRR